MVIGYNQQDFAPAAVKSVLNQTYQHLECIFVDDGSEDATFDRVHALGLLDARLTIYRKENGGPSSARNFGARQASSSAEFIAFLDGDDLFRPEFIRICLAYLETHPDAGVMIPGHDFIDESGAPINNQRRGYRWIPSKLLLPRRMRPSEHATPFVAFYCGTGSAPFWMARFSEYRKTDGWDEMLWPHEDTDMLCQLAMVCCVHAVGRKLVQYRIHLAQVTQPGSMAAGRLSTGSLNHLQEKWNRRRYADTRRNRCLDRSCLYYRQVHLPFRALWVARRALGEFIQSPSPHRAIRLGSLIWLFLRDFTYFKICFWRSRRRYIATKFYEAAKPQ